MTVIKLTVRVDQLGRPPNINAERAAHWTKQADSTRNWRIVSKSSWLRALRKWQVDQALHNRPPTFNEMHGVEAHAAPLQTSKRHQADVGACAPAVKAVIDGAVDAGLMTDDNPNYLTSITYYTPRLAEKDGLVVTLIGETDAPQT